MKDRLKSLSARSATRPTVWSESIIKDLRKEKKVILLAKIPKTILKCLKKRI